ncbi:MAG: hypothetical protein ACTSP3_05250 [Candidatus Heimdallarchaeaceae archaeon]
MKFLHILSFHRIEIKTVTLDVLLTTDYFFTEIPTIFANKVEIPILLRISVVFESFYAGRITEKLLERIKIFLI